MAWRALTARAARLSPKGASTDSATRTSSEGAAGTPTETAAGTSAESAEDPAPRA